MTRIKQFANDMGLSYNQAKDLVMQGRKKKDGGSTVLEKFMPIEIVPTKRKKNKMDSTLRQKEKEKQAKQPVKKQSGGGFDEEFRELRERMKAEDRAKAKPTAQSRKEKFPNRKKPTGKFDLDLMQGTGALKKEDFPPKKEKKISKPKKKTSPKVISPGKQKPTMTDEQVKAELEAKTKPKKKRLILKGGAPGFDRSPMSKYHISKKFDKGGSNKVLKPIPPDNKGLQALKKERPDVVASMGFKKKGGMLSFDMGGMNDMEDGTYMAKIESLQIVPTKKKTMGSPGPRPTPKGRGPARGGPVPRKRKGMKQSSMKRPRRMMGGGMYDMNPKRMSGGGVARGTGAAVKGTGFKGVY